MDSLPYSPILVITFAAIATYASRGLGTLLSGRLQAGDEIVEWITCVTYALMAGLIVRMIILPIGALTETPDWVRIASTVVGLIVFFMSRKNIGLGVLAGSASLACFMWS